MHRPRFLMCAPAYFGVEYIINPWMKDHLADTDRTVALEQWKQLQGVLASNAEVELIAPVDGLPDLVFTANAALIRGPIAVLSSFRCPERQSEEPHYQQWLETAGFQVVTLPSGVKFEGAGDALLDRGRPLLWAGHGFRSDRAAAEQLRDALGIEVVPLRLIDPRFYHLDTCFCPLEDGYLLYFAGAFDEESQAAIESRVAPEKRLAIAEADAVHFACNAVNVGRQVVTNHAGAAMQQWLAERGFETVVTPMTEFMKAGGAAKCLSLRLDEPQR